MRAVLERDFLAEASRGRSVAFRCAVGAVVAFAVLAGFASTWKSMADAPDVTARAMFGAGSLALLSLLVLLTPPLIVGSVLGERQQETLSLVLASPLPARSFALAKLLARSAVVLTWGLAALFPLAAPLLVGGVSGERVLDLAILCFAAVVEVGAWGLWVSTASRRLATAAVLAYLLPLARWGVFALPFFTLGPGDSPIRHAAYDGKEPGRWWLALQTTPIPGAWQAYDGEDYGAATKGSYARQGWPWIGGGSMTVTVIGGGVQRTVRVPLRLPFPDMRRLIADPILPPFVLRPAHGYLVYSLLFAVLAVAAAGARLRREHEPQASRWTRFLRRRRWIRPPPDGGNPMAWKERRLLNTSASRPLYYTVLALVVAGEAAFVIGLETVLRSHQEMAGAAMALFAGQVTALALVAALAAATSMAHEASLGTLDLLRSSGLTGAEILRGKIRGILSGLGILAAIPALHAVGVGLTGVLEPVTALVALTSLGIVVLFWTCVGLWEGILHLHAARALLRTSAWFGLAVLGLPAAAWLLGLLFPDATSRILGEMFLAGSVPLTVYGAVDESHRLLVGSTGHWWRSASYASWSYLWLPGLFAACVAMALTLPVHLRRRLDAERGPR